MTHRTISICGTRIGTTRLLISIRQLRVAMETENPFEVEGLIRRLETLAEAERHSEDGIDGVFDVPSTTLSNIADGLSTLCDSALKMLGRVRVRYVHDLKPTDYGTDVHVFHLTDKVSREDMHLLMRDCMAKPGSDGITRVVNLSLVRDIEIRMHSRVVSDVHKDYSFVHNTMTSLRNIVDSADTRNEPCQQARYYEHLC